MFQYSLFVSCVDCWIILILVACCHFTGAVSNAWTRWEDGVTSAQYIFSEIWFSVSAACEHTCIISQSSVHLMFAVCWSGQRLLWYFLTHYFWNVLLLFVWCEFTPHLSRQLTQHHAQSVFTPCACPMHNGRSCGYWTQSLFTIFSSMFHKLLVTF